MAHQYHGADSAFYAYNDANPDYYGDAAVQQNYYDGDGMYGSSYEAYQYQQSGNPHAYYASGANNYTGAPYNYGSSRQRPHPRFRQHLGYNNSSDNSYANGSRHPRHGGTSSGHHYHDKPRGGNSGGASNSGRQRCTCCGIPMSVVLLTVLPMLYCINFYMHSNELLERRDDALHQVLQLFGVMSGRTSEQLEPPDGEAASENGLDLLNAGANETLASSNETSKGIDLTIQLSNNGSFADYMATNPGEQAVQGASAGDEDPTTVLRDEDIDHGTQSARASILSRLESKQLVADHIFHTDDLRLVPLAISDPSLDQGERITLATYVQSLEFDMLVNFIHGVERLDNKGFYVVNPNSVRIVVYHLGGGTLTPYHEHLLHTAAYGKGRARPQFELHFRKLPIEPVTSNDEYDRFISMVATHRALVLASAVHDFGSTSASVVYVDPGVFVNSELTALRVVLDTNLVFLSYNSKLSADSLFHEPGPVMASTGSTRRDKRPDGNIIGFSMQSADVLNRLLLPWVQCVRLWSCLTRHFRALALQSDDVLYRGVDLYMLEDLMLKTGLRDQVVDTYQNSISPEAKINLLAERRKDMWGKQKKVNEGRNHVLIEDEVHEAEIAFLRAQVYLNFVAVMSPDTSIQVINMISRLADKERGVRRGDIRPFGSYDAPTRFVAFTVGLSDADAVAGKLDMKNVRKGFKNVLKDAGVLVNIRYGDYPRHCQFGHNSNAYKAVAINKVIEEYGGYVLWMDPCVDGSCLDIKKPLDRIRERLATRGVVSFLTGGTVGTRVDPTTYSHFGLSSTSDVMDYKPLDSSILGINAENEEVRREVWEPMFLCVLNETCITPPKAPKSHQNLSAVFTSAVYSYGLLDFPQSKNDIHVIYV